MNPIDTDLLIAVASIMQCMAAAVMGYVEGREHHARGPVPRIFPYFLAAMVLALPPCVLVIVWCILNDRLFYK